MKTISAILRIISGIALIIVSGMVYSNNAEALAGHGNASLQIFGHGSGLTPGQLKLILLAALLIGVLFTGLGLFTFFRKGK